MKRSKKKKRERERERERDGRRGEGGGGGLAMQILGIVERSRKKGRIFRKVADLNTYLDKAKDSSPMTSAIVWPI